MKHLRWVHGVAAAAVLLGSAGAAAQTAPSADALPGGWRVGLPDLGQSNPRLSLAGFGGYGWIPGVGMEGGDHHRATGSAAVSVIPVEYIGIAAGLSGFWDVHPDDALGGDDSGFGMLFLALRGGFRLPEHIALGADVRWDFSGAEAPDLQVEASRLSLRALGSIRPLGGDLTLGLTVGYRLDGSARTVGNVDEYRTGDRVSLGAASNDAVLLGLTGVIDLRAVEIVLESTFEPYVGEGAPGASEAPLRFAGGVRIPLVSDMRAHAMLEVTTQRRLALAPEQPLVPSEPRVAVLFGITYSPSFAPVEPEQGDGTESETQETEQDTVVATGPRPIAGAVRDEAGAPVADASVELLGPGDAAVATRTTAADGRYAFDPVPAGSYRLRIQRDGFDAVEVPVEVGPGEAAVEAPAATLAAATPAGALRGLVRDFRGTPVRAQVRIAPSGQEAETDDNGLFEIEVPPGSYDVEVRAQGFVTQQRQVRVNENGVTILNVDLRRDR